MKSGVLFGANILINECTGKCLTQYWLGCFARGMVL
jgi:hypothetical protein